MRDTTEIISLRYRVYLYRTAVRKYGRITPCGGVNFSRSMFVLSDKIHFWFNDSSRSTRAVTILKGGLDGDLKRSGGDQVHTGVKIGGN